MLGSVCVLFSSRIFSFSFLSPLWYHFLIYHTPGHISQMYTYITQNHTCTTGTTLDIMVATSNAAHGKPSSWQNSQHLTVHMCVYELRLSHDVPSTSSWCHLGGNCVCNFLLQQVSVFPLVVGSVLTPRHLNFSLPSASPASSSNGTVKCWEFCHELGFPCAALLVATIISSVVPVVHVWFWVMYVYICDMCPGVW
jgi:hypothetical protein